MKAFKFVTLACLLLISSAAFANIPVGVSLPKTAKAGEAVTISVKTDPKVHCKIEAQDAGLTQALSLTDKESDNSGMASWYFRIPENYKSDKMPVIITVSKMGEYAEDKCVKAIQIQK